ncbi:MAG: hypothetical protein ACE5JR_03970 [Gemmatimonadota bacterium]
MLLLLPLAACGSGESPTAASQPPRPPELLGIHRLSSLNGQSLPALLRKTTLENLTCEEKVLSGSLQLSADGRYARMETRGGDCVDEKTGESSTIRPWTETEEGSYSVEGIQISFVEDDPPEPDRLVVGVRSGPDLVIVTSRPSEEPQVRVYRRQTPSS